MLTPPTNRSGEAEVLTTIIVSITPQHHPKNSLNLISIHTGSGSMPDFALAPSTAC
jgi:hypothetical protein